MLVLGLFRKKFKQQQLAMVFSRMLNYPNADRCFLISPFTYYYCKLHKLVMQSICYYWQVCLDR